MSSRQSPQMILTERVARTIAPQQGQ
jgi:hypothetical protein